MTMNEILMEAVIESLAFAELTGEDLMDLRAAVKHEETLSYILSRLSAADRETFCLFVAKRAAEAEREYGPGSWTSFLRSLPSALGLVE